MAIQPLVIAPDPRLKTKSATVETIDDSIRALAKDLFDTMYFEKGIGLAAVQIGVLKRVLVADISWRDGDGPGEQFVLINPEILNQAELNVYKEGCLSFPDQFADVERPKFVRVHYQDLTGAWVERDFDGLLATCIQHEIDHLNGKVFVDHISPVKRDMILRKMKKIKKHWDSHDHSQCGHDHGHNHHHEHEHVHGEHCNH